VRETGHSRCFSGDCESVCIGLSRALRGVRPLAAFLFDDWPGMEAARQASPCDKWGQGAALQDNASVRLIRRCSHVARPPWNPSLRLLKLLKTLQ
jgi:hypothetical protein